MASAVPPCDRRLHQGWQFREVYQSGKSFHGSFMTLVSMVRAPEEWSRAAFVASRKVGSAVRRNRAKRLLREAYRATPTEIRDRPRWRVWIARAACTVATLQAVRSEMDRLIAREVS
jgi:ribonuclease P protein component